MVTRRSSQSRFAGSCLPTPLPEIASADPCVEIVEGKCIDLALHQGGSFAHTIIIPDAGKGERAVTAYTPNVAGSATLTLSDASCIEIGDCLLLYGICDESACDSLAGYYTVTGVSGDVVAVAEAIAGDAGVETPFVSTASTLCPSATTLPSIVVLADLTNVEFEMSVYNRMGKDVKYNSMRVVAQQGSSQLNVCPEGRVCDYDCVNVPDLGIDKAQVLEVFPNKGYDTIVLRDQVAGVSTTCALLDGGTGRVTPFRIDRSQEACGTITFFLNPDMEVISDADGNEVTYLGTSDLHESACNDSMKGSDCEQMFVIGHYHIKMTATDPASLRVDQVFVQHGKLYGQSMGLDCA